MFVSVTTITPFPPTHTQTHTLSHTLTPTHTLPHSLFLSHTHTAGLPRAAEPVLHGRAPPGRPAAHGGFLPQHGWVSALLPCFAFCSCFFVFAPTHPTHQPSMDSPNPSIPPLSNTNKQQHQSRLRAPEGAVFPPPDRAGAPRLPRCQPHVAHPDPPAVRRAGGQGIFSFFFHFSVRCVFVGVLPANKSQRFSAKVVGRVIDIWAGFLVCDAHTITSHRPASARTGVDSLSHTPTPASRRR